MRATKENALEGWDQDEFRVGSTLGVGISDHQLDAFSGFRQIAGTLHLNATRITSASRKSNTAQRIFNRVTRFSLMGWPN